MPVFRRWLPPHTLMALPLRQRDAASPMLLRLRHAAMPRQRAFMMAERRR